ncbi:flagellar motor switch protein FliG [Alphaproteobacteria bacterium GH1-50]|uniref:Flagellar motor switch protein FliG n=2 Tax=Kangsaoukella pontilimi TaxID=2691042 RepID=A0A7C9J1R8_9RHOB|nr:flagellar motor switch protein FliG [Kangsaoukella pontilimi]
MADPGLMPAASTAHLSGRQKAAIVVRLLLSEGAVPALSSLPESTQTELAVQLARMAPVDRNTVDAVAAEFADEIEAIGLSFPKGLEGALGLLDGVISSSASSRVRKMTSSDFQGDPWEQVGNVDNARLVAILEREAIEVAAIILSKLKVSKAAELLGLIEGDLARRITYAISLTGSIAPETVRRIGISLAEELDTRPARAFSDGPVSRVGAILNSTPASVRDTVLTGLDEEDSSFAEQVRKAIFTFANIRERVSPRDIPRIQQAIDQADLVTATAFASDADAKSVAFFLDNISQRLADSIRAEAEEKGTVTSADGEAAMMRIVTVIRQLESAGEIFFVAEDE